MDTTTTQMNNRTGYGRPGGGTCTGLVKAFLALTISLVWGAQASAVPVNGSFESGFSGWDTLGNTSIQGTLGDIAPIHGNKQALLTTYDDDVEGGSSGSEGEGEGPVDYTGIESFLGLTPGSLAFVHPSGSASIEGSAIKTTFFATKDQIVSFSWNFLTTDPAYFGYEDFALVSSLMGPSQNVLILADTFSFLFPSTAAFSNNGCSSLCSGSLTIPDPTSMQTRYGIHSFTIPTTGTYTLGFGIITAGDDEGDSALLVDNVSVVPEPSSIVLLLLGLVGLVWWRRSQMASA